MTSPEDDGLEAALRRALSEAVSDVQPGGDGLEAIRARIAGRPPRPWLVSLLFGAVERVRYFTWRGHWAWPGWLARLGETPPPRPRRGGYRAGGKYRASRVRSLRVAAVVAAAAVVALVASITLGMQPLRHAILQAGTDVRGEGSLRGTAGTEGDGAQPVKGEGDAQPARGEADPVRAGAPVAPGAGHAQPGSTARCQPSALPAPATNQSSAAQSSAAPPSAAAAPASAAAPPVYTGTSGLTCPVTAPAPSPTAPPAASAPTPSPAPPTAVDSSPTSGTLLDTPPPSGDPASGGASGAPSTWPTPHGYAPPSHHRPAPPTHLPRRFSSGPGGPGPSGHAPVSRPRHDRSR